MPILVKNVEWHQTDDEVVIKIPKANAIARNADVVITETFVKVNFQPYLYETVLAHAICPEASVCKILENCIKFVLKKKEPKQWIDLESTIQSTKSADGVKLKSEMVEENRKALEAEALQRKQIKRDEQRANVEREMKREQKIRDDAQRVYERVKEMETVQQSATRKHKIQSKPLAALTEKPISEKRCDPPPIRSGGTINVTFSTRRFVTPKRESQEHVEREWCLKQNQLKQDIGFSDDDLNADERNPKWLLAKGKEFYAKNNYLAAISAFSAGINLAECPAELLLRRAMAHYKLSNYSRCVSWTERLMDGQKLWWKFLALWLQATDVSQAYDLFVPPVMLNKRDRAKCLLLRAKTLKEMGFSREAEDEALAALKLDSTISEWDMSDWLKPIRTRKRKEKNKSK